MLIPSLKELLRSGVTGTWNDAQLRELHRLTHTFALQIIRSRIQRSRLALSSTGLSEDDLAFDSIAALFARNNRNQFIEFADFFPVDQIDGSSEEMLLTYLRSFVSRKVKDHLFELYGQIDPAFARILRNLKLAVERCQEMFIEERFGDDFLVLKNSDAEDRRLPVIDEDTLRHEVHTIMMRSASIPEALDEFIQSLRGMQIYQKAVRLLSLAAAIKESYSTSERDHYSDMEGSTRVENLVDASILRKIIAETCGEISARMKPNYLKSGKLDEEMFENYIQAIERCIVAEFLDGQVEHISYLSALQEEHPSISSVEYGSRHRVIIEYIGKIAKAEARIRLQKIL